MEHPVKQTAGGAALFDRVSEVLELIRPVIRADGGDFELLGVTREGVVRIRLLGACIGCPSSTITLKMGIEENLRAHVPGIHEVVAVQ